METDRPRQPWTWLPDSLTMLRLLLLPVLVLLMRDVPAAADARPGAGGQWSPERVALVALFLAMAATDWLDGYLARRLRVTSRWGSLADAVADRLAMLVPLLYIALLGPAAFPEVPLWIPLWLLGLDVLTGAAWLVAWRRYGVRQPASHRLPGRVGTWFLFGLVLWVLMGLPAAGIAPLALVGLGLASVSAGLYIRGWLRHG